MNHFQFDIVLCLDEQAGSGRDACATFRQFLQDWIIVCGRILRCSPANLTADFPHCDGCQGNEEANAP